MDYWIWSFRDSHLIELSNCPAFQFPYWFKTVHTLQGCMKGLSAAGTMACTWQSGRSEHSRWHQRRKAWITWPSLLLSSDRHCDSTASLEALALGGQHDPVPMTRTSVKAPHTSNQQTAIDVSPTARGTSSTHEVLRQVWYRGESRVN